MVDIARARRVFSGLNGMPCDNVSVAICAYRCLYTISYKRLNG